MPKQIILLNGPSSSGKSTLALQLQSLLKEKLSKIYEIVSIDDFMKISKNETIYEDDVYEISLDMCNAAKKKLDTCDGVIIDHVITSKRIFTQLKEELSDYDIFMVHVTCPLEILKQRENSRGDRCLGSAEASYKYLYPKTGYDLVIDTSKASLEKNAYEIFKEIFKKQYLLNPCKASSLPFWKTCSIKISDNMVIFRDDEDCSLPIKSEELYFKMIHNLEFIGKPNLNQRYEVVDISLEEYVNHINECYEDLGVSLEELKTYQKHQTYNPNLWIAVKDKTSNKVVATAIAELDSDIKEGVLEWIQVSKNYRNQGLGKYLINEILYRLKDTANFVTVSGRVDNPTHPFELYKSCGFVNPVIWHIAIII